MMRNAMTRAAAGLALVATLLLVAMPTVGRYFGSGFVLPGEATGQIAADAPMHDMASMTPEERAAHMRRMTVEVPAPPGADEKAPAAPHKGHSGHDCDYCPLLSGLVQATVHASTFQGPLELAPWTIRAVAAPPAEAPVPALGAQGPPSVEHG